MAPSGTLLVGFETLGLGLRYRLVELGLTRLVDAARVGVKSARVVAKRLKLLVLGAASALETDARLARALRSAVSALFRGDVLRVGAASGLTSAADADRGTGEFFETGLVDARLFGCDGGLGVERIFETPVCLVVQVTELIKNSRRQASGVSLVF